MFKTDDLTEVIVSLFVKYNFQYPLHLVMVGINEAFVNLKFNPNCVILAGRAKDLRFPINCMFVDGKGDAAHVLFKMSGEPSEITPWYGNHRILS